MQLITSKDNPLLKQLRLLSQDSTAYRKIGRVWLEGDHLCRALLDRGQTPTVAVFSESHWPQADERLRRAASLAHTVPDRLMTSVSGLESPAGVGFVWELPEAPAVLPNVPTVDESGLKGYESTGWYGLYGPRGMPRPVVDKLNAAVKQMVQSARIVLQSRGATVPPFPPFPPLFPVN